MTAMGILSSKPTREVNATSQSGPETRARSQHSRSAHLSVDMSRDRVSLSSVGATRPSLARPRSMTTYVNNTVPSSSAFPSESTSRKTTSEYATKPFETSREQSETKDGAAETKTRGNEAGLKDSQEKMDQACHSCEALETAKHEFTKVLEVAKKLEKQRDEYLQAAQKWHQKYKSSEETKSKLAKEVELLKSSAAQQSMKAEQTIQSLQQRIGKQQQVLKGVQEEVFETKGMTTRGIAPDSVINAALTSLERAIKGFCKQHAVKTIGGPRLDPYVQARETVRDGMIYEDGLDALHDSKLVKSAPCMLLTAWLTHEVYQEIVASPFFFVAELERSLSCDQDVFIAPGMENLLEMMELGYGKNSKVVNNLRSELFKLLIVHDIDEPDKKLENMQEAVKAAQHKECVRFVHSFVDRAQQLMASDIDNKMVQQLMCILDRAVKVCEQMFVQPCRFAFHDLSSLPDNFDASSPSMEAHANHVNELDKNEHCLNGKNVLFAASPSVIAFGSSDGSDPSVVRILKKAVVWMGKPEVYDTPAESLTRD